MDKIGEYTDQNRPIIYGDESGFSFDMPRLYAYSLIGQRAFGSRNFGAKKRTNVIGALYKQNLLTSSLFDCNVDSDVFNGWLENDLIPKLPEKAVFVVDNASFHKEAYIKSRLEPHGHNLLLLPPYSPELNPIEHKWAQAKRLKRKHQCNIDELFQRYRL